MTLSTRSLAAASARHAWRTIGAWIIVAVLAVAAIATLLGGSLTTEGSPTNNPESERADDVRLAAFPDSSTAVSDIVVIRSEKYTVYSTPFEAYVREFVDDGEIGALGHVSTYLDDPNAGLVSEDRHATIVPIALSDDDETEALVEKVEAIDKEGAFAVSITGTETLDHDFNLLSQEDLENGELKFGLPAALIILLLVFGAVVAGLVPLLMAIVSIIVALGLSALLAQQFELSVFLVNMLTGMGLALGIDYSLFVVSRYREERAQGRARTGGDRGLGRHREPGGAVQRQRLCRRHVRDAARPQLDHAQPRGGSDPRRDRLRGRGADAPAGRSGPPRRQGECPPHPHHRARRPSGIQPGRTLLGGDRASRPASSRAEPGALDSGAARARDARVPDGHRHERCLRAPRPLRLETGLPRARARLPGHDHRPRRDRRPERICHGRRPRARTTSHPPRGRSPLRQRRARAVGRRRGRAPLRPGQRRPLLDPGNRRRERAPLGDRPADVRRNEREGARGRHELREHRLLRLGDRPRAVS